MVRGRVSLWCLYIWFISTALHGAAVWVAGTPATLGTYPSRGQDSNPGLDFLFDTFQDFVIFALTPNTFHAFQAPVTRRLVNSDVKSPTIVKRVNPCKTH